MTLDLGNLNLLWEVRYSVWICLDKIFSFGLSCLHVFQSLLWIVSNYELSKTKTKKTTSRLANFLCCSFTRPSLRLGSLFNARQTWRRMRMRKEKEKEENEENEEKEPQLQVQPACPTAAFWLATNVEQAAKPPLHWLSLASNLSQMFKFPRFNPLTSASRRATCTRASPFSLTSWHIFSEKIYFQTWHINNFASYHRLKAFSLKISKRLILKHSCTHGGIRINNVTNRCNFWEMLRSLFC